MRQILFILIVGLFLGCGGSDKPSKPDNLIPKDKMSEIIYDVFVLNAAKGINKRVLEQNGVFPEAYVFKKYKIDSLQFALSNDYYSYDIKTYEGIIDRVKEKIDAEKKKIDIEIEKEEKIKDSLNSLRMEINDSIPKIESIVPELDTLVKPKPKIMVKPKQKSNVFGQDND